MKSSSDSGQQRARVSHIRARRQDTSVYVSMCTLIRRRILGFKFDREKNPLKNGLSSIHPASVFSNLLGLLRLPCLSPAPEAGQRLLGPRQDRDVRVCPVCLDAKGKRVFNIAEAQAPSPIQTSSPLSSAPQLEPVTGLSKGGAVLCCWPKVWRTQG